MRALVTGGEGFVGGHLIDELAAAGHEVSATAFDVAASTPILAERSVGPDDIEWTDLDVLDPSGARAVVAATRPDAVFHLAGFSSGARARREAARALRTNAEGTLTVLDAVALEAPAARVVVAGSADVYGDPGSDDIDEDHPVAPVSPYGLSKAAQELVALGVGRQCGLDVRVARLFPLVGPRQSHAFVVPSFSRQAAAIAAKRAEPVLRVGNLDVTRDFMDVRDGVEGLIALSALDDPGRRCYNVCSGRGTTIRELLAWILAEAGIDPEVVVDPDRVREGEPGRIVGTAGRLQSATGWAPAREVREAVRETYSQVRRSNAIH